MNSPEKNDAFIKSQFGQRGAGNDNNDLGDMLGSLVDIIPEVLPMLL